MTTGVTPARFFWIDDVLLDTFDKNPLPGPTGDSRVRHEMRRHARFYPMTSLPLLRSGLSCLSTIVLISMLSGCGETPPAAGAATPAKGGGKGGRGGGAAPVIVGQVQRKTVPLVIDAIGAVEPIRTTAIRSQVTGTLMKIAIQEGQNVKQGDLLFEIDPRPFHNALRSAEADLQKVKVQLETALAQVARYRSLTTDQMVSKEQFERISDAARSLEAEVLADESRVANAKLQLEYCSIRSPITGRTGNLNVHEGDLVRTNDNSGNPLVTVNQLNPIYVTFGVPQQYLASLTRYRATGTLKVTVVPPGLDETPEEGELTFMDNMVDASTGTLKLKGSFPNATQRLWPGQFATVGVTLAAPEAVTIPSSAVQTSQSGQHVYVVKSDKLAELRPVVVERTYESDAVISKGLAPGETIVIEGQLRVIPGKPVDIKEGAAPAGSGSGEGSAERAKSGKKSKKET
jgi:multidrug efflux system membrane fusion protein